MEFPTVTLLIQAVHHFFITGSCSTCFLQRRVTLKTTGVKQTRHMGMISTQQNWRFHHSPFLGFLDLGDLNL
jgi:hypothetical protein